MKLELLLFDDEIFDAVGYESALHEFFKKYQKMQEWFLPSELILKYIYFVKSVPLTKIEKENYNLKIGRFRQEYLKEIKNA